MKTIVMSTLRQISSRWACICARVCASSAPNGSSISRMRGWLASARAIATRCFMPPESWCGIGVREVAQADELEPLARLCVGAVDVRAAQLAARTSRSASPSARETACSSGTPCRDPDPGPRTGSPSSSTSPRGRLLEPGEDADQRRLAAARRADHAENSRRCASKQMSRSASVSPAGLVEALAQVARPRARPARCLEAREARAHLGRLLAVARAVTSAAVIGVTAARGAAPVGRHSRSAVARGALRPRATPATRAAGARGCHGNSRRPSHASTRSVPRPISPIMMIAA